MNLIAFVGFIILLVFQSQGIQAGDSGDLVTAAATFGVAHPPGYPLYSFIGWLLNHIPLYTPAWRVGLLSSMSHAVVMIFIGKIVYRMTKSKGASYFAMSVLFGNYLFFLYSVTPEVFALLDLFIVLIIWFILEWIRTKSVVYLYLLSFLFGLSLTHHHLILFFVPAIFWITFHYKAHIHVSILRLISWFVAGLLPYLYVVFPPYGESVLIWNPAITLSNFIRLVTRADYGTFQSATVFGQLPIQRLLNVQAYIQYIYDDFLWIGCVFAVVGARYLVLYHRKVGVFLLLGIIFMGPVFFFYASFPLVYRFSLGTFERFMLPSYVFIVICIGVGFARCMHKVASWLRGYHLAGLLIPGISLILFIYPLFVAISTITKFQGYATDKTAEYLATDILSPLPPNSIILVSRDTVLFTTQYLRYARGFRPDLIVVHASKLSVNDQRNILKARFPSLSIPPKDTKNPLADFVVDNAKRYRIFSYSPEGIGPSWAWVPHGLVYELYSEHSVPTSDEIIEMQSNIWSSLHDPSKGILSRYNHLMLSDVRDIYTTARVEYGKILQQVGKIELAREQFERAIAYGGDSKLPDAYMYKGISEMVLRNCDQAKMDFESAKRYSLDPMHELTYYSAINYRDCFKDQKKYDDLYGEFQKQAEKKKTPLQSL